MSNQDLNVTEVARKIMKELDILPATQDLVLEAVLPSYVERFGDHSIWDAYAGESHRGI